MAPSATENGVTNGVNGVDQKLDFKVRHSHAVKGSDYDSNMFQTYCNIIKDGLSCTEKTRHNTNPATLEPNPEVPVSTREDVDKAVAAARAAFKSWSKTPVEERGQKLRDYADAIDELKDDFANMLTLEQGKPLAQSYTEIGMATTWLRAFSNMNLPEDVIEDSEDRKVINRYTPL
ncbi:MAG: hypothetical protein Q9183_007218, partial [Haloplaca sp. 2 TL-2023]